MCFLVEVSERASARASWLWHSSRPYGLRGGIGFVRDWSISLAKRIGRRVMSGIDVRRKPFEEKVFLVFAQPIPTAATASFSSYRSSHA